MKIAITIFSLLIFLFPSIIYSFSRPPELDYPFTDLTNLPGYIIYLYNFAVVISAFIALGALVYGGFKYLTSAGNPSKVQDGLDQIKAAIFGILIVLCSYLILKTINPNLVVWPFF
ncbi:MAG: hypothetical protein PHI53_02510 [Candidatus Pacebacteria bacterium]|nr:hypothetical protein [Candidatus Paceibacterota bacterium]